MIEAANEHHAVKHEKESNTAMANPDDTQSKFDKSRARAAVDIEAARVKTEAKIAKANAKLHIEAAQDAADATAATNRAAAERAKSVLGQKNG